MCPAWVDKVDRVYGGRSFQKFKTTATKYFRKTKMWYFLCSSLASILILKRLFCSVVAHNYSKFTVVPNVSSGLEAFQDRRAGCGEVAGEGLVGFVFPKLFLPFFLRVRKEIFSSEFQEICWKKVKISSYLVPWPFSTTPPNCFPEWPNPFNRILNYIFKRLFGLN